MKNWFPFTLLGAGALLLLWLRQRTPSVDTSAIGYSFGQVGTNLNLTDTRGDALASALAAMQAQGDVGDFEYLGPDFVLRVNRFGDRTKLRPLSRAEYIAPYAPGTQRVQLPYVPSSNEDARIPYAGWYEVVGEILPTFNANNPATYLVL